MLARARNLLQRLRSGLPLRGEVVTPHVPNDVYQAQRSLHLFAGERLATRHVLALECGSGWGPALLVARGARSVLGLTSDPRLLAHARRSWAGPAVTFAALGDLDQPGRGPAATFDGAVAFALARQPRPQDSLRRLSAALAPGALLVAAVPPVVDDLTRDRHRADPALPGSRYVWEWEELLRAAGAVEVRLFRHEPPPGSVLDLTDPRPSPLAAEDFGFVELAPAEQQQVGWLGAVFVARWPA
jgi:hypothetical protein